MTVFTCRDNWEDILTCIYEAWASGKGHRNIRLELEPVSQQELFCEYIHIDAEEQKAMKVCGAIRKKISWQAYQWVYYAAHSARPEKTECIYRFLILGFHFGKKITEMLTENTVMRIMELSRRVTNEEHIMREAARFTYHERGIYVCHIEPEHDILLMLAEYFEDRMPSETWMITDDGRRTAVIHLKDKRMYQTVLTEKEWEQLQETERIKDIYTTLWNEFFHTIGIRERENRKCQNTMMPLHYRKHMTEFM